MNLIIIYFIYFQKIRINISMVFSTIKNENKKASKYFGNYSNIVVILLKYRQKYNFFYNKNNNK